MKIRSVEEWEDEDRALRDGGDPTPCPRCGRRGFYGPRFAVPSRKYFACKFCGYWQDVNQPPHVIIRYECNQPDHRVADWKRPDEGWQCPGCGHAYQPVDAVAWPATVLDHLWRSMPEAGSQADFIDALRQIDNKPRPFGVM